MKLVPVPITEPPVAAANQLIDDPALAVAARDTVPVPQRPAGVVAVICGS